MNKEVDDCYRSPLFFVLKDERNTENKLHFDVEGEGEIVARGKIAHAIAQKSVMHEKEKRW